MQDQTSDHRQEVTVGPVLQNTFQQALLPQHSFHSQVKKLLCLEFPGNPVVKNPTVNAEGLGSVPGLGRSHVPRGD